MPLIESDAGADRYQRELVSTFRNAPRLGFSTTFADIFSPNEEEVNDYIKGILAVTLILMSVFLCWLLVLLVFKCCLGPKRVGFLSGAPFQDTVTRKGPTNDIAGEDNTEDNGVANPWINRGRIVLAISCVGFLVFSIVLVTAGLGNLNTTTVTIGIGATKGYDYLSEVQMKLDTVTKVASHVSTLRQGVAPALQAFADALNVARLHWAEIGPITAEQLNITLGQVVNGGQIPIIVEQVIEGLVLFESFLRRQIPDLYHSISNGQETFEDVYAVSETIDLHILRIVLGVVMTILPLLLLGCLIWRVYNADDSNERVSTSTSNNNDNIKKALPVDTCRTWFILPLFCVMVFLGVVTCNGIFIAGLVNNDFCTGSKYELSGPDSTILEVLDNQGYAQDSLYYRLVEYVVRECDHGPLVENTPLENYEDFKGQVRNTLAEIGLLIQGLDLNATRLTEQTGYNVTQLIIQLEELRIPMQEMQMDFVEFLNSLACRQLYEIYHTMTHQAACSHSYYGTLWVFISLLLVSFFGLLAITFRSALYPVVSLHWDLELKEKQEEPEEADGCLVAIGTTKSQEVGDQEQPLASMDDEDGEGGSKVAMLVEVDIMNAVALNNMTECGQNAETQDEEFHDCVSV